VSGSQLGLVGIGVMGHALALNAAEHGFPVAAFDRDAEATRRLVAASAGAPVRGLPSLAQLAAALEPPRTILLLVPAGSPVDDAIGNLLQYLAPGDLVVDGGNSFFRDTERRAAALEKQGIHFMGLGISGGEYGARHGASLMPGGRPEDYDRVRPLLEAIAARVEGRPCVARLGPGAAGHYVKMVHNGIEYAVMQLIAETYDLLRRGLGLDDTALAAIYERWNQSELESYLLEITTRVLRTTDEKTGSPLVQIIADEAGQKGTGRWCSQDAMNLGVPVPNIDAAVAERALSGLRSLRQAASRLFPGNDAARLTSETRQSLPERLRGGFHLAVVTAYAQGMSLLGAASEAYRFGLDLAEVARVWRGGCIIRAALLREVQAASRSARDLSSYLLTPQASRLVAEHLPDLRTVVRDAVSLAVPVPGLMSALAYLDSLRSVRLPTSLIQAQRDYFGGHGFHRLDADGTFHGRWAEVPEPHHAR
jgi:6-phosphogluconate dehydrogenase